jgi:hypothetical protein
MQIVHKQKHPAYYIVGLCTMIKDGWQYRYINCDVNRITLYLCVAKALISP